MFEWSPIEFEAHAKGSLVEAVASGIADAQRFHEGTVIDVVGRRVRVVRRIRDVERFGTELQLGLFTDSPLAVYTHTQIDQPRSSQGVGAAGAEAPRGGHAEVRPVVPLINIGALVGRRRNAVGPLCGGRGVQRAVVGDGCKRRSSVSAQQAIDLPAAHDLSQRPALGPRLTLSERKLDDASDLQIMTDVAAQVAVIQPVVGRKAHVRPGSGSLTAIAAAVAPSVADADLVTTREAVLQARLEGVVLGSPEGAQEARGSGAAELAIQDLARGARADRRPVRIEQVQLIRCPRGHVTG